MSKYTLSEIELSHVEILGGDSEISRFYIKILEDRFFFDAIHKIILSHTAKTHKLELFLMHKNLVHEITFVCPSEAESINLRKKLLTQISTIVKK